MTDQIADIPGQRLQDWVTTAKVTPEQAEKLRAIVYRVAAATLKPRQYQIFVDHYLEGLTMEDIAARHNISQPTVHQAINGQIKYPSHQRVGGILTRIRKAVTQDQEFHQTMEEINTPPPPDDFRTMYSTWYDKIRQPAKAQTFFVAYAVWSMIAALQDARNEVHINTLLEHMPAVVVNQVLGTLKAMKVITFDGITLKLHMQHPNQDTK